MPGRPFQGARIRLAAGTTFGPLLGSSAERLIRPDALNLRRASNRTRPPTPQKKKQPPGRARLENRSSPKRAGRKSKRAHALFSHPPDAQKRVCGGIAAQSRRCGGAASQLYDQFRPHFAINRLRRKRHKPQRGSPNSRTWRRIFPAAPFELLIARRNASEDLPRPGPILARSRPDPAPALPSPRTSRKSRPNRASLSLKGGGTAGLDSLRPKRPNSQTRAAQSGARVSEA